MNLLKPTTIPEFLAQYSGDIKKAAEELDEAIEFAETKLLLQNDESPIYQTMIECMEIVKRQIK